MFMRPRQCGNTGLVHLWRFGSPVFRSADPDRHLRLEGTGGTWNTSSGNLNVQTGDFDVLGLNNRALGLFQDTNTGGYLTYQSSAAQNYLVKTQIEFAPGWSPPSLI